MSSELPHMIGIDRPRVGLVLGAGGVLGGAWLVGALHAIASESGWDPGSADYIVGTSAGSMIGALVACGVPPWFMVAHSAEEQFDGLSDARGEAAAVADRSAGATFRLERSGFALGPGSWRLAVASLARPYRYSPMAVISGWLPRGLVSTEPLKDTIRRACTGDWAPHPHYWPMALDYTTGRRVAFGRAGIVRCERIAGDRSGTAPPPSRSRSTRSPSTSTTVGATRRSPTSGRRPPRTRRSSNERPTGCAPTERQPLSQQTRFRPRVDGARTRMRSSSRCAKRACGARAWREVLFRELPDTTVGGILGPVRAHVGTHTAMASRSAVVHHSRDAEPLREGSLPRSVLFPLTVAAFCRGGGCRSAGIMEAWLAERTLISTTCYWASVGCVSVAS